MKIPKLVLDLPPMDDVDFEVPMKVKESIQNYNTADSEVTSTTDTISEGYSTAAAQKSPSDLAKERQQNELAKAKELFEDAKTEIYLLRQQKNIVQFVRSMCKMQTDLK